MARVINGVRIVDARLGVGTLSTYGRHFAVNSGLDGWSIVDVTAEPVTGNVGAFLMGNNEITQYVIPSNVNSLCQYCLASFPNVTDIYITNYDEVIDLSANNIFGGLVNTPTIHVPSKYLSDYQTEYTTLTFDTWLDNYDLYISNNGNAELSVEYVNGIVYGLTVGQNASVTRTFIGSDFTTFEFGAMDFVFDGKVPNSTIELSNETLFLSSAFEVTQDNIILEVE